MSLANTPRRHSTSQVKSDNPPPLPNRKLSDLPPLHRKVPGDAAPPLPTRNKSNTLGVQRQRVPEGPPLPRRDGPPLPTRDRSSWKPSNDTFEERFRFHKESDFPPPEPVHLNKKIYPSTTGAKKSYKSPSPPPPPPPVPARKPSNPSNDTNIFDYVDTHM